MIYFKTIKWRNFLSTGNAYTTIDFTKHRSTLIVGENGAGKSTLLDALCFVLYGKPFRKINKPQLVNSINGKGLEVEIEFSIGKKEYKIKRGIKPSIFEIYQDGVPINQDAEARDYQEMLERSILKLSYKSFSQIVILGSASFVPFMQLSAANRRDVIEDLLDIQIFSTMNVLLRSKVTEIKEKIILNEHDIKSTTEKIFLYRKYIASLMLNNEELIYQKNVRIDKLKDEIAHADAQIVHATNTLNQLVASISDEDKVKRKLHKIQTLLTQVENKLEKISKEVEFFGDHNNCPTCKQSIEPAHKEQIVEKNVKLMNEIAAGRKQIDKEITAINDRLEHISVTNKEIERLTRVIDNTNIEIRTKAKFIDDIKHEINQIKNSNTQIDSNNEEINKLNNELSMLNQAREELAKDKQVLDVGHTLLKDSGIKTKIIRQYVPIINKLINKYLAAMDFFVNFELNENFEETIKSRFRDEFSYESFSEGEKSRIDLALLFTWRAVSKLRNSASTNLLILDEVFDGSLDGQGSDELMKILNTLTNDTNTFVISHKTDQLFDKFANVIRFQKVKNFSQMVQ